LLKHCPIDTIPNTLSLPDFQMMDKAECRKQLGLPLDKRIIIFGAARVDDPIKGFPMILDALSYLKTHNQEFAKDLHLVTFGIFKQAKPHIPIDHTDIGWVKDNATLSMLYSASDALISASLYETFGQTLIEAQACGCLPISFGNSGQTDIIRHKENGYLAEYLSPASLADGIIWTLTEGTAINRETIRTEVLNKYSAEVVASRYMELYTRITQ
jgi:glycosyltransferase involved in cell wall biosynthesis